MVGLRLRCGAMETPARVGGALIGGFGAAAAMRPSVAGGMVREALENVTPQQIDAAEELFQPSSRPCLPPSLPANSLRAMLRKSGS